MPSETSAQQTKSELLVELKRDLASLKVSMSVLGEGSESTKDLALKRSILQNKINQLESEMGNQESRGRTAL